MTEPINPWYPAAGSYGVVSTPGFGAWLIRKGTHSWADHAFIVVDEQGGLVEAMPGGVRRGTVAEYAGRRVQYYTEGTPKQRERVVWEALGMLGRPYDELDLVDIGLECLGLHPRLLTRWVARQRSVICSQAVAVCGRGAGLDWSCGHDDLAEVTPAMLAARPAAVR